MDVSNAQFPPAPMKTPGLRESLCSLDPITIPRPKFTGMEYIPTMGRFGYYQSLRRKDLETKKHLANLFPPDYDQSEANQPVEFRRLGENFQKISPTQESPPKKPLKLEDSGKRDLKPPRNGHAKKEVKFADNAQLVK